MFGEGRDTSSRPNTAPGGTELAKLSLGDMNSLWVSSNGALQVSSDQVEFAEMAPPSHRFSAPAGAPGATVELTFAPALDLSQLDEVRFWIRADRVADGSLVAPFYLEFYFADSGDGAADDHRWFVGINQAATWEQRRIGIASERRSSVTRIGFRSLGPQPFTCNVDDVLAVREEMLLDLETELAARLGDGLALPNLSAVPLAQAAAAGATELVLPLRRDFDVDNRVLLHGGSAGDEEHVVTSVTHDVGGNTTRLGFAAGDAVVGSQPAGSATVTLLVPVIAEDPPRPTAPTTPAVVLTMLESREDAERTPIVSQRDSFRRRGALTVCSVRRPARAYLVDYQITVVAPRRSQQLEIQTQVLDRLCMFRCATSLDVLRINGYPAPVTIEDAPQLIYRQQAQTGLPAPMYIRVGTRMETAPRAEVPWVRHQAVAAAAAPGDADEEKLEHDL